MAESEPIRYMIDFKFIPELFYKEKWKISEVFIKEFLAASYTAAYKAIKPRFFWQRPKQFSARDFKIYDMYRDGTRLYYVALPPVDDSSDCFCAAYVIVLYSEECRLFTVEKSIYGEDCIGTIDENNQHILLEHATDSVENNMEIIYEYVLTEKKAVQARANYFNISAAEQKPSFNTCTKPSKRNSEIKIKSSDIMNEVYRVTLSCSSPPIGGTPEENARYVMGKIAYFRENGVSESELYELESKILRFIPDYVAENFAEFYAFLKEDISSIILTMDYYMARGDYAAAKKIADPVADYLEKHKEALIDGHHCHQNIFETAMYTLEEKKLIETQHTKSNYTGFLILYAKVLQNTRIIRNNREEFCMKESRKFLLWAKELSPQNAGVWLYLGVSYHGDEMLQLEHYKKALQYCYIKDGEYGLTAIYEHMAMHYWGKNQTEIVAALKDMITELGGNPFMITFLLSKRQAPVSRPYRDTLRKHSIPMGFSELVRKTADFLIDPRTDMQNNQEVHELLMEIQLSEAIA